MIPLCVDCQHHLNAGIDTRKVLCQQEQLIDTIKSQTDANLQVAADLKKLDAIVPLFDTIELQLKESVTNVNINTSSKVASAVSTLSRDLEHNSVNKTDELVDIKNHLTSLFNISMEATRKRIEEYVKDLTIDLSRELQKICGEVENLSSVTIGMASHCNEHNDSQSHSTIDALDEVKSLASTVGGDILREVKSLADAIYAMDSNLSNASLPPAVVPPSLMDELAEQSMNSADVGSQQNHEVTEGWRTLGSRKVWRSDWTQYDIRKQRRVQQQKARVKAIKRRKANKKQWNINNTINNSSNTNKNYKTATNNNRPNSNSNHDNQNNNIPTCSYNYNSINNNNNNHHNSLHAGASFLPPDKDLLAAAKVTFSRPPVAQQRGIRFQRGETLNPYPVDHLFPHASDRIHNHTMGNSFSQHCSSCSCERSCFRST